MTLPAIEIRVAVGVCGNLRQCAKGLWYGLGHNYGIASAYPGRGQWNKQAPSSHANQKSAPPQACAAEAHI